ncbi:hypothetical protein [Mycoplasmopsis synoviae]|uniref:hypothetical protein n=2 Tax=Mycoplasmopsis synoviae TaxID=2109 RepID=UPI00387AFDD3
MIQFLNLKGLVKNYNGIVCIETNNSDLFIRKLFEFEHAENQSSININNNKYSIKDFIIIDNLTKYHDLYNFNSKGLLNQWINDLDFENQKIVNEKLVLEIKNLLNNKIGFEFVSIEENNSKYLKYLFNLENDKFIDNKSLIKWMKNQKYNNQKINLIIKNFDFVLINELIKFSNNFNIIVLTNDFFKHINNFDYIESVALTNEDLDRIVSIEEKDSFEYFLEEIFQDSIRNIEKFDFFSQNNKDLIKKSLKINFF